MGVGAVCTVSASVRPHATHVSHMPPTHVSRVPPTCHICCSFLSLVDSLTNLVFCFLKQCLLLEEYLPHLASMDLIHLTYLILQVLFQISPPSLFHLFFHQALLIQKFEAWNTSVSKAFGCWHGGRIAYLTLADESVMGKNTLQGARKMFQQNTCCSFRGTGFGFQHPHQVANNCHWLTLM